MQQEIKKKLQSIKKQYAKEGVEIIGVFGSVAREEEGIDSDVDIVYRLDYALFFSRYEDGFSQVIRLQEIKEELERLVGSPVDFISYDSASDLLKKSIEEDLVNV
jgi:predicted nucleotidyltransferase